MARDKGLEELIHGELHSVPGITKKPCSAAGRGCSTANCFAAHA